MSYHHQWLYLSDDEGSYEVFNGARTAAYLANPTLAPAGDIRITDVLDMGGCDAYAFDPPCDDDPAAIVFPGTTGNNVTVPDSAALDIVGDITLIFDGAMVDWTPATDAGFIGKWTASPERAYLFAISTTGFPYLSWTVDGATVNTITSTIAVTNVAGPNIANGNRLALRVDFDVNNGASGRTARFYWAWTHDGPWTLLSSVTQATVTSIDVGTSVINLGNAGGLNLAGDMYWAEIRNGISTNAVVGGTLVLAVDPAKIADPAAVTFSTPTLQTATIARTGVTRTAVKLGELWWEPIYFTTPELDDAPWFTTSNADSKDVLGFYVEEWTGLDNRHVSRSSTPIGRARGGALMSPPGAGMRVMKLNVLVMGRTERALEYAFDWLSARLSNVCASCSTSSLLLRKFCPETNENLWNGVAELREVGLVEDLSWESPPMEQAGCVIRRLSFTLGAGDPCMYMPIVAPTVVQTSAVASTCFTALPLGAGKADCRPLCSAMPSACRTVMSFDVPDATGAMGPIVRLTNDNAAPVPPLRVVCYADPNDLGVAGGPCGLPILGEIYTQVIPPWTTIEWDVAGRQITYSDASTGGDEPAWTLIDANDPPNTRYFALPCGSAHIVIEPANVCLTVDAPNSRYTHDGYVFDWATLHFPTATLQLQERRSCA